MDNLLECLSLMELLELRDGAQGEDARTHVARCPRCSALDHSLPDIPWLDDAAMPDRPLSIGSVREAAFDTLQAGQIWRVEVPGHGQSWPVAIYGPAPEAESQWFVMPIVGAVESATDTDLLLDETRIGYESFVDVLNLGAVASEQMIEPIGELSPDELDDLRNLYRASLRGVVPEGDVKTGPAVLGPDDPRLLESEARALALRNLWRTVDATVGDDRDSNAITIGALVQESLSGDEWDRTLFLEKSEVDSTVLDNVCRDKLDLTHRQDVADLAKIIGLLEFAKDVAIPAVDLALRRGRGGEPRGTGTKLPLAARSPLGMSEDETTSHLFKGHTNIDESAEAREKAICAYLADLDQELDSL